MEAVRLLTNLQISFSLFSIRPASSYSPVKCASDCLHLCPSLFADTLAKFADIAVGEGESCKKKIRDTTLMKKMRGMLQSIMETIFSAKVNEVKRVLYGVVVEETDRLHPSLDTD